MSSSTVVRSVLSGYPADCAPRGVEPLGNAGGFSGAQFWRIDSDRGLLCLRCWPREHPSPARLDFIHHLLRHVHQGGFQRIPLPITPEPSAGSSYLAHSEHLWELTPWLPGVADDTIPPSPAKLRAALQTLAEFHVAAETFPTTTHGMLPPAAIVDRLKTTRRWTSDELERLVSAMGSQTALDWPGLPELGQRIVQQFQINGASLAAELAVAAEMSVSTQPCIRDIWQQHVLFDGDNVTGFVDFGAARFDTVSTDISRLLGSLVADDPQQWRLGLDAYLEVRSLSPQEIELTHILDRSSVLLSGLNWLRWIYLEGRSFSEKNTIQQRLSAILARLSHVQY